MSILQEIVESTKSSVIARKAKHQGFSALARSDRSFLTALSQPGIGLISEIKRKSPSRGLIRDDFDPAKIAAIYGRHASAISVLTNHEYFGGKSEFLQVARQNANCPILAKDFFVDPFQIEEARSFGADAVLLMASVLEVTQINDFLAQLDELHMNALVEVHSEAELDSVLANTNAPIVGVNSRDLNTLSIHEEQIFKLGPQVKASGRILVAESGIFEKTQVEKLHSLADAVLIGSSIMLAHDIEEKIVELGW